MCFESAQLRWQHTASRTIVSYKELHDDGIFKWKNNSNESHSSVHWIQFFYCMAGDNMLNWNKTVNCTRSYRFELEFSLFSYSSSCEKKFRNIFHFQYSPTGLSAYVPLSRTGEKDTLCVPYLPNSGERKYKKNFV